MAVSTSVNGVFGRTKAMWFFFLLALANLMWAGQGIAVKFLEKKLGPIAITFLPFYIATILLLPLLYIEHKKNPDYVRPSGKDWIMFCWAGILGQVAAQLGSTWGIKFAPASNFAILNLMIPVFTAFLAAVMLKERMTPLRVVCLVIGLAGVCLLSTSDLKNADFFTANNLILKGNLLILLGCLGSAFYNVYCKGLFSRFKEIEILIYSYITASLSSIPLLIWAEPFHITSLYSIGRQGWLAFAFLAIFLYGVSMLLFFYVLHHLSVTVASASLYLVPLFGVLLAYHFLGEHLGILSIIGGVIVLVSTMLIMKYDNAT